MTKMSRSPKEVRATTGTVGRSGQCLLTLEEESCNKGDRNGEAILKKISTTLPEPSNLHRSFAATTLDRESLPQSSLDIAARVRTNPFPWKGQFSPQLVEQLLVAFAPQDAVVLDPFVGSGTSLVEAARLGLSARGCDLNPAAVILARVYGIINLDEQERTAALDELRERLIDLIAPPHAPLFTAEHSGSEKRAMLEAGLVRLWQDTAPGMARNLAAALVVLCDFHRKLLDATTVHKTWLRLEKTVNALPTSTKPISVYQADARALPIESDSVDLILSSPPYINVHNYHQKYRRSVEAMGWNVLSNAHSEIGSNRQNRGNRFLTVIQYSLDMALALREMVRVANSRARLILVLGRESTVKGIRFFNGELVTEIAVQSVGLKIERRQERVFRNRYGTNIYEDILHFQLTGEVPDQPLLLMKARQIAKRTLLATKSLLSNGTNAGIDDALARIETVVPSPVLQINSHSQDTD